LIDNTVIQEGFKRIDALAEKLGVTATYLWPKLVAWQYGETMGRLVLLVLAWILLVVGVWAAWKYQERICDADFELGIYSMLIVGGAVTLVFTFVALPRMISTLISPEAAAFYKLIGG